MGNSSIPSQPQIFLVHRFRRWRTVIQANTPQGDFTRPTNPGFRDYYAYPTLERAEPSLCTRPFEMAIVDLVVLVVLPTLRDTNQFSHITLLKGFPMCEALGPSYIPFPHHSVHCQPKTSYFFLRRLNALNQDRAID